MKELLDGQKLTDKQQSNVFRALETQLEMKDQELATLDKERQSLGQKTKEMEEAIEKLNKKVEEKEREIEEISTKIPSISSLDYKASDNQWNETVDYKRKIAEVQNTLKQQTEQISKMQGSLKAHAQLAVALKLEKDNAIKYSNKLRDILQEVFFYLKNAFRSLIDIVSGA